MHGIHGIKKKLCCRIYVEREYIKSEIQNNKLLKNDRQNITPKPSRIRKISVFVTTQHVDKNESLSFGVTETPRQTGALPLALLNVPILVTRISPYLKFKQISLT